MGEFTKSLEFTQDQLDEEISNVKKEIEKLYRNIKSVENDFLYPEEVSSKLIESEERSCSNNLSIDGIHETPSETWDLCEENLQNIIMNKLGIEGPVEIEQWHQMGYKQQNKSRPLFAVLANLKKR